MTAIPSTPLVRLTVAGFRNLVDQTVSLGPGTNLVMGSNGQGKTSLLEAIYLLATGKSFRGATAREMTTYDAPAIRIVGDVRETSGKVTLAVELSDGPPRTRRFLAGGKGLSPSGYLGLLPAVAVTSDRMEIVRGGPEERRRFLDRGILLEQPAQVDLLRSVEKVLRQKSALLADDSPARSRRDALSAWNRTLAEHAARLRSLRRAYAADLGARIGEIAKTLGRPSGPLEVTYQPSPEGSDLAGELFERFEDAAHLELTAGRVRIGPGRDDLSISVAGHPAREHASAGEQKAIVLAMKLAKIERAGEVADRRPVLLLDDLDAELDRDVLRSFLERLPRDLQVIATSAKGEWIEPLLGGTGHVARLRMEAGKIVRTEEPRNKEATEPDHRPHEVEPGAIGL